MSTLKEVTREHLFGAIEKWFEFCTIKHYKMANRGVFLMALVKVLTRDALKGAHAWTLVALGRHVCPEAGLSVPRRACLSWGGHRSQGNWNIFEIQVRSWIWLQVHISKTAEVFPARSAAVPKQALSPVRRNPLFLGI